MSVTEAGLGRPVLFITVLQMWMAVLLFPLMGVSWWLFLHSVFSDVSQRPNIFTSMIGSNFDFDFYFTSLVLAL